MKKILAVMLCLMILLAAGCAKKPPVETQAPTTIPTEAPVPETTVPPTTEAPGTEPVVTEPPAPETEAASSLVDHAVVIQAFLERGASVEIVGEYDDTYYVVKTENGYGLLEKLIVRLEGEPAYESWTGYAYGAAKLYNNYHMVPVNVRELNLNTQVKVLECFEDICLVQVENTVGYMLLSQISRTYIVYAPSNQDGGDISLGFWGGVNQLSNFVAQEGDVTGTGTVLVDEAELIIGWFDRGESMEIVTEADFAPALENYVIVYADGLWGYVNQALVVTGDAEPYAEWSGYARGNSGFYDNVYLAGEPTQKLNANTVVRVVGDLGDVYLVSVNDVLGYMAKDQVSTTQIVFNNQGGEWSDPVM